MGGQPFAWHYEGTRLPISREFKYLGVVLHSTRGMRAAVDALRAAGMRAAWGVHGRCRHLGIVDFSLRARLFRSVAEPVLTYCSEVWAPDLLLTPMAALRNPLQAVHNDYLRHLGGLRRCVPVRMLCWESGMSPLSRAWVCACAQWWDRLIAMHDCPLKRAFVGDLQLAARLQVDPAAWDGGRSRAQRCWSGAWLQTLHWLSQQGGAHGRQVGAYLTGILNTLRMHPSALPALGVRLPAPIVVAAWDEAWDRQAVAAVAGGVVHAAYAAAFAPLPCDCEAEPGFPASMPYYFRHTARFHNHEHARALMRLRCCSTPFAACPTRHADRRQAPPVCTKCNAHVEETAEHALLDCPHYAHLRADPRFAPLFQQTMPPLSRMRTFVQQQHQHKLAAFVHACFERHEE